MIRNNLTGAQVQKMADNARLVKTGNDCKAAYNALKKVPNERAMFVELTVKEAKECFAETLLDMPYNSFRKKET